MYFQDIIMELNKFWAEQGCVIQHPYDMEVGWHFSSCYSAEVFGAGTMEGRLCATIQTSDRWEIW